MKPDPNADAIRERLVVAGLAVPHDVLEGCADYLALLAVWNRRINLTALPLSPATPQSIDRLIVEPLIAAQFLREGAVWADLGSGGGSPAIPLKVGRPDTTLTMVEARERKGAFLREAVRALGLARTSVLTVRFEEAALRDLDVVTIRAVRISDPIKDVIRSMLKQGGTVLAFGADATSWEGFSGQAEVELPGRDGTRLTVAVKS